MLLNEAVAVTTTVVHKPLPHDSARLHVQGSAAYVDDIREPEGTLHVAVGGADKACGVLRSLDLGAVRAAPGVVAVLTAANIPGKNDIAPVFADEPLFAEKEVMFHGQALFAVVAGARDEARRAARLAKIDIEEQPPSVTVADALKTDERVQDDYAFGRGDAAAAIRAAAHRLVHDEAFAVSPARLASTSLRRGCHRPRRRAAASRSAIAWAAEEFSCSRKARTSASAR